MSEIGQRPPRPALTEVERQWLAEHRDAIASINVFIDIAAYDPSGQLLSNLSLLMCRSERHALPVPAFFLHPLPM